MKLKSYQLEAVKFLRLKKKAILNMGCRTGKTYTALAAAKSPVLVIGPPAVENIWLAENQKLEKPKNLSFISRFQAYKLSGHVKTVIVDEMHQSMKWHTSKPILKQCQYAKYCFLLSATPIIHSPEDYYWPLKICGEMKQDLETFRALYCRGRIIQKNHKAFYVASGTSNMDVLKEKVKKVSFRYFRKEHIKYYIVSLGEAPLPTDVGIEDYSKMQATIGFLKLDNHRFISSALKYRSERKIVFHFHKKVGERLGAFFPDSVPISGETPVKFRENLIKAFNDKRIGTLIINYKAAGIGYDIKNCDLCLFVESTYSPFTDYQALMRAYGFKRQRYLKVLKYYFTDESKKLITQFKQETLKEV